MMLMRIFHPLTWISLTSGIYEPNIITEKVREKVAVSQPGEQIMGGNWTMRCFPTKGGQPKI